MKHSHRRIVLLVEVHSDVLLENLLEYDENLGVRNSNHIHRYCYMWHRVCRTEVQTNAMRLLDSGTLLRLKRSRCSGFNASGCAPIHHWRAMISATTSLWYGAWWLATQS